MKKVGLFLVILVLISMISFIGAEDSCIQTDGAYDLYKKGNITIIQNSATVTGSDSCFDAPFEVPDGTSSLELVAMSIDKGETVEYKSNGAYLLETTCASSTLEGVKTYLVAQSYKCQNRCQNGECIQNISTNNNQTCTEDWQCEDWETCIDNSQTRTCTDLNNCNTTNEKPSEIQTCTTNNNQTCEDAWDCTKWSDCVDETKTRTCTKTGNCNNESDEPSTSKKCKRKKLKPNNQECPEECICKGSTIKCNLEGGGREMTIYAGKSGNIIVQVKGVNMSTKVTLYKENGNLTGIFRGNKTKIIKILPDQIKEKIKEKIKAKLESEEIELDEEGIYQIKIKKRARLFFIIPVGEDVRAQIDSETGNIINIKNPWWGFLARDVRE